MNQEILEAIDIIATKLLSEGDFCGSVPGRRLHELRYQLCGTQRSQPMHERSEPRPLVNRTLTLPVDLDNAVGVIAERTGTSRNALIEGALEALIAEKRLG